MKRTPRQTPTRILQASEDQQRLVLREARLAVSPADGGSWTFAIAGSETTIGSEPENDLVLEDPFVSGRHAVLRVGAGGFVLEDLGSTNGTLVGRARIERAALEPGGEFVVGKTRIRLEAGPPAPTDGTLPRDRGGMVGESPALVGALRILSKIAPSDLPVLLMGETGTGKELAARFVHAHSPRATGPFLAINCAAVTPELFESELFGHERGAFTSATGTRVGLLEMARGGTVFLDEVGEMPLLLQPKLLRVLEEQAIRRVGSNREIATDVRIIAATNRDLAAQVKDGAFRRDLFYRLSVVPVTLPTLAERGADVLILARHFLAREAEKRRMAEPFALSTVAAERLVRYGWPGNVRELRNLIAVACQLAADPPAIDEKDLFFAPADAAIPARETRTLEEVEADAIRAALARTGGNTKQAARLLGLALSTMYDRMKKHGIPAPASKRTDETD